LTSKEIVIEEVELPPRKLAAIEREIPVAEISEFLAEALPTVFGHVMANGGQPASAPLLHYLSMNDTHFRVQAGVAITEEIDGTEDIEITDMPGGKALTALFVGPYANVGPTWDAVWAKAAEMNPTGAAAASLEQMGGWDEYTNDPTEVGVDKAETRVYLPL